MATSLCTDPPPGPGSLSVLASLMIKFYSLLHLSLDHDRGHHIKQTESLCFGRFSVRDISCKQNIKV